jgi:hypothetical protein
MAGSTLGAMAEAIEASRVVLMCVSRKYKESPNCRVEAEYAFTLGKPILPLMMQPSYRADGWLGAVLGAKFWHDCTSPRAARTALPAVLKELTSMHGGKAADVQVTASNAPATAAVPIATGSSDGLVTWSAARVGDWLASVKLGAHTKQFAKQGMDGRALDTLLTAVCDGARPFADFKACAQADLGFERLGDVLTLWRELKRL